jgi:hypothetical protein|eukprot:SAG25_NODE_206_length_11883_cov_5.639511_9_plen_124_part_00
MWVLMASPIISGNRLDRMSNQTIGILTNAAMLKVNQDSAGIQGVRTQRFGARTNFSDVYGSALSRWEQEVWVKPLLLHPGDYQQWGFAIALVPLPRHGYHHDQKSGLTEIYLRFAMMPVRILG